MSAKEFHYLKCNSFWAFLFSQHEADGQRRKFLTKILSVMKNAGKISEHDFYAAFWRKYRRQLDLQDLNELFCVNEKNFIDIFRLCGGMFIVENNVFYYDASEGIDQVQDNLYFCDLFANAVKCLEKRVDEVVLIGDKIMRILRETNFARMDVLELISYLRLSADEADPKVFIGHVAMYFAGESLVIEHDSGCKSGIALHLRNLQYLPRLERIEKVIRAQDAYPSIVDQTEDESRRFFHVRIGKCTIPSDGFFLYLNALEDQRSYVLNELKLIYETKNSNTPFIRIRPLAPNKGLPCLLEANGCFLRGRITGQTGEGRVMVECVDEGRIVFVTSEKLYEIPRWLLGIPVTGIYGVLACPRKELVFLMSSHPSLRNKWMELVDMIEKNSVLTTMAYIINTTSDSEYSGFRKSVVYKVQLMVEIGGRRHILPDIWQHD